MKSVKNEFPNPVLAQGRDDYIDSCSFSTLLDYNAITVNDEFIVIPIKYCLNCIGIQKLLEDDQARVAIRVISSAASYSQLILFDKDSQEITLNIPKYDVVKSIELCGSIIANNAIHNFYCPEEFNEVYFANAYFDIRKGDILATEDPRILYIDDSELEKPISSIFDICCSEEIEDEITPVFDEEKIKIYLSPELNSLYKEFTDFNKSGSLRRYANSVIVLPVLVEAIRYIRDCETGANEVPESFKDKRWYRAIEKKVEKYNYSFADPKMPDTSIANKLLGEIASDAMKSFKDTFDAEANSGETEMIGGVD